MKTCFHFDYAEPHLILSKINLSASAIAEQRRSLNYLHFSSVWRQPYRGETEERQFRGEGLKGINKTLCIRAFKPLRHCVPPPLYFASQNTEEEFKCMKEFK